MRLLVCGLLVTVLFSGCTGAGLTYDVLTSDNIIAAAQEAKKGVVAFNETVVADTATRRSAMLRAVGTGVKAVARNQAISEAQAEALANSVVASLEGHLANYAEQDRRRAHLFAVTIDNLNYIIQISEQSKTYSIYRADIGAQWKAYIESSARSAITAID